MLGKGDPSPQVAFGLALRQARQSAGMSQEALGLEAGVDRNFVSLMETGQNQPTITTVFKLAAALKMRPSQLVERAEAFEIDVRRAVRPRG